jgi:murein DD-endopeptidase MepM/ murein hydrolase activator NlpD
MSTRPALRAWHLALPLVLLLVLVVMALARFRHDEAGLGVLALPSPGEQQAATPAPETQLQPQPPAQPQLDLQLQSRPQQPVIEERAELPPTAQLTASPPQISSLPQASTGELPQLRARHLTLPVQGVIAGQLTDTYTQARAAGRPHEALDIMAARGTPVLAVEDGRVAKLFLSQPGGITLYQFDPAGDYAYYYAHLDRYADGIVEGASLHRGDVIGYVGSTGNASPDAPHLHFAIFRLGPERQWWRGTALNPFLAWRD